MEGIEGVTPNPLVMCGKPCICGMRVTVGMILEQLRSGTTVDEWLDDPILTWSARTLRRLCGMARGWRVAARLLWKRAEIAPRECASDKKANQSFRLRLHSGLRQRGTYS
jgi:hypothetical protein